MTTYQFGTKGNDTFPNADQKLTGSDYYYGLEGNDTLYYEIKPADGNTPRQHIALDGGADSDKFHLKYDAQVSGDTFVDVIFYGSLGEDTLYFDLSDYTQATSFNASPSAFEGGGKRLGSASLYIRTCEHYVFSGGHAADSFLAGAGDDTASGGDGADTIQGGAGNDKLAGGADNDTLNGGTGNDTMNGGAGDDALYSNSNQGADSLDGGAGTDFAKIDRAQSSTAFSFSLINPSGIQTLADGTTVTNVERIQFEAGSQADQLTGGALNDVLAGNGGNDSLKGGGGDDILIGGSGDDTIRGSGGNDTMQLSGKRTEYAFTNLGNGNYGVSDQRNGSPDGTDTFSEIETVHFSDGYAKLSTLVR